MASRFEDIQRRIIPRWRRFRDTQALGELSGRSSGEVRKAAPASIASLEQSLADWREVGGLALASDALGLALVLGRLPEANDAANFIASRAEATASARSLLVPVESSPVEPDADETERSAAAALREDVVRQRRKLSADPRNALAWVDLARNHTILGNRRHAERAIRIALAAARGNRFVLRSASRFLLHIGEFEQAHDILRNAASVRSDPWLLAAEIAVASKVNRASRFAKIGLSLLEDRGWNSAQTSELESALATLEMTNGNTRGARKLFRRSLTAPTENSVAQVEWASRQNIGLDVSPSDLSTPRSFEARAREARAAGLWDQSFLESALWFRDQPFSKEAASFASYVASVPLERYDDGAEIAHRGLVATPRDPLLLNNLVFSLASAGKVAKAGQFFAQISAVGASPLLRATLLATQGLLCYRVGDTEQGRQHYLEAIAIAKANDGLFEAALAALFFAREAALAGAAHSDEAWALALTEAAGRKEPEVGVLRSRLANSRKATASGSGA